MFTQGIAELEANGFTDKQTRAVMVTWVLFNVNFNMFNYARVLFEFTPGGVVLPSMQTHTFRMDTYGEAEWQWRFCMDMLFVYCTFYWFKKIRHRVIDAYLDTASYLNFFFNFWNFMDVAIVALCVTYISLELYQACNKARQDFDIAVDHYVELGTFAEYFELSIQMNAFAALLIILRLFEFLNISERIALLSRTIMLSVPDVVSFMVMFSIIFTAFAMMAHTLFG